MYKFLQRGGVLGFRKRLNAGATNNENLFVAPVVYAGSDSSVSKSLLSHAWLRWAGSESTAGACPEPLRPVIGFAETATEAIPASVVAFVYFSSSGVSSLSESSDFFSRPNIP